MVSFTQIMAKTFIVHKKKQEHRKNESRKKTHKQLNEFYSSDQKEKEKIQSVEDQIFEHLKQHTKKVLKK